MKALTIDVNKIEHWSLFRKEIGKEMEIHRCWKPYFIGFQSATKET